MLSRIQFVGLFFLFFSFSNALAGSLQPGISLGLWRERPWLGKPEVMERFIDALREAGLPE